MKPFAHDAFTRSNIHGNFIPCKFHAMQGIISYITHVMHDKNVYMHTTLYVCTNIKVSIASSPVSMHLKFVNSTIHIIFY